jgi:type IV pilus assembly protein PilE
MNISGFTFVDVMITMVIISVLSVVSYPSCRQYILNSHRVEAKMNLVDLANQQEQFFLQKGYYATLDELGFSSSDNQFITENGFYSVSGNITNTSYVLMAVTNGNQTADVDCQTFILKQDNSKTSQPKLDCWK